MENDSVNLLVIKHFLMQPNEQNAISGESIQLVDLASLQGQPDHLKTLRDLNLFEAR